ncbi:MAG: Gfo/Idh/MocA family oxidoreductase, partial [Planctomycetaceae bacterium]|nr:Gfo/Idh/MocA family oxidoreductase [Planctomycetaceae bacterium]
GLIGSRHVLDFQDQPDVNMVAMCETHAARLGSGLAVMGAQARGYRDFREMYDNPDIDAVCISTPDHWHALQTMLACAAGKDVYVEKPVTLFPREGDWMLAVADRHGSVVQIGTQQRSGPHYQRAKELIQSGHIGQVTSVRMQAYRNVWPGFGNYDESEPPTDFDYAMWLGPAPEHPYHPLRGIYHFRWFWDYSGGQMTNLGQHSLDIVDWVLDATTLKSVVSSGGRYALTGDGETPDTQDALYEFDGWTAEWASRETSRGVGKDAGGYSLTFYGNKGSLGINRSGFAVVPDPEVPPESLIPDFLKPKPTSEERANRPTPQPRTEAIVDESGDDRDQFRRHVRNFLDCIRTRERPVSDLASGCRVANLCHLANISLRTGRKVGWDAGRSVPVDDPEVLACLTRPYRAPWDRELAALGVG